MKQGEKPVREPSASQKLRVRKDSEWNEQNAAFIKEYNKVVEAEGVSLQEWRTF